MSIKTFKIKSFLLCIVTDAHHSAVTFVNVPDRTCCCLILRAKLTGFVCWFVQVHLPQGTVVKVLVTTSFLNVWVQASTAEFNNTEGNLTLMSSPLCIRVMYDAVFVNLLKCYGSLLTLNQLGCLVLRQ